MKFTPLAVIALFCSPFFANAAELHRYEFTDRQMGMPIRVVMYAESQKQADVAVKVVWTKFAAINAVASDYQDDSEIMRLSRKAPKTPNYPSTVTFISDDLAAMLQFGLHLSEQSDGAFDLTIGPLTQLWRKTKRSRRLPEDDVLKAAREAVDYRALHVGKESESGKLVSTLSKPNMRLDLGGIAAGYAIDQSLAELKKLGIDRAMIDSSGDIGCSGPPPGERGWRIGIAPLNPNAPPSRYVRLSNAALTTSGDAYQHITLEGQRYSHIVDPKTGLGLTRPVATTVIARDCMSADALATTLCILGHERGFKLLEKYPGSDAVMLLAPRRTDENPQIEIQETPGLKSYEEAPTAAPEPATMP
jgi:thiamine biosynthesis lipoprotein